MSEKIENIGWNIRVSIFRNSIILKQLGIAIGVPFGLLILFLIIVKAIYALIIIAALFLFTFLFILVLWGGKYNVDFELNKTGIHSFTHKRQAKQNFIINNVTMVLGFLSGKPAVSGAAMLAQSRQYVSIKWSSIRKVRFLPDKRVVMINAGFAANIALFCTLENYEVVESLIKARLKGKDVIYSTKGGNSKR